MGQKRTAASKGNRLWLLGVVVALALALGGCAQGGASSSASAAASSGVSASAADQTVATDGVDPADASGTDESPLLNRSTWAARMDLPTDEQVSAFEASDRSPYIVCWPQFGEASGYTEYAVDFKADSQPLGTYVNIANWWMDTSSLNEEYAAVETDDGDAAGGGYAGFQVLEDGRKVAIMSIWRLFLTDADGKESTLDAKRAYPESPSVADDFEGEGTGVKTLVDYDWQAGRTYRALIQCGQTEAGNCELAFSVCDLESGDWTKLVAYDLGYGDTSMEVVGCFLENYLPDYAAQVRTAEWGNFRAKLSETGSWDSAKSAKMERQFEAWTGSYNFGSTDSCFWAITSGVPELCAPPGNGTLFNVLEAAEGAPAE